MTRPPLFFEFPGGGSFGKIQAGMLHVLNMMIVHQLGHGPERLMDHFKMLTVPPLCPLGASRWNFSQAAWLISGRRKNLVLDSGGLRVEPARRF